MKNIITFDEFVNESLLLESFKSQILADFKSNFIGGSKGNFATKLPKGILWDQIPDSEIIPKEDERFNKKLAKDTDYVIFWYNSKQQTVKWNQTTYTKWGVKRDNNIYLRANSLLITKGMNFLYGGYYDILDSRVATNKYEKPLEGALAVSRLFDDIECAAFAIKWSTLEQYSSSSLRTDRTIAQKGAIALMKETDILYANQRRYDDAIKASKLNKGSKPIAEKVESVISKIRKEIEEASKIPFNDLVTFSTGKFGKEGEMESAYLNKIDYSKLEALTRKYNDIVSAFNYWYNEYKSYIRNNSDSYKTWADTAEERLNALLANA
jgi:hypothetical protein